MIRKPKANNPKVIREGGRKIDQSVKHGSEKISKCIVTIEKLRPQQLVKNFKVVVQKLNIDTILNQQEDSIKLNRTCISSCKTCPDLIV